MALTLCCTMGVPGSGKSTWAREHATRAGLTLLSLDDIRLEGVNPVECVRAAHAEADRLLSAGCSVLVDSCNTSGGQRGRWLRLALEWAARPELAVLDTDHDVARERNSCRPVGQRVPDAKMAQYFVEWEGALRRARSEGWHLVQVCSRSSGAGGWVW